MGLFRVWWAGGQSGESRLWLTELRMVCASRPVSNTSTLRHRRLAQSHPNSVKSTHLDYRFPPPPKPE